MEKNFEKSMKQTIWDLLVFIYGDIELERLKNFFLRIAIYDEANIIIFTTRRCHVLFCLFRKYIFSDEENRTIDELIENHKKLYITDKAIHFYDNQIANSICAIVDDLLIHGRALGSVRVRLESKKPQKVVEYVYAQSEYALPGCQAFSFTPEMENKRWKLLSNQIVASLLLSSTPYTSYIYSYTKEMAEDDFEMFISELYDSFSISNYSEISELQLDLSLQEVDNKNKITDRLKENVRGYILPLQGKDSTKFLRIYYNKITNLCILTPTVFIGSYTNEQLVSICEELFFDNKLIKETSPEIMYRILTAVKSISVFDEFKRNLPDCLNDNSWKTNENDIDMSYYEGFYKYILEKVRSESFEYFYSKDEIYNTHRDIIEDITKYYVLSKISDNETKLEPDIYLNIFKEQIRDYFVKKSSTTVKFPYNDPQHDESTIFLYDYITTVNKAEEFYIEENNKSGLALEKQVGFSFALARKLFDKNIMNSLQFYSKVISGADSGLITFYADSYIYDDTKYYSNFLITGEQVCRLYQNQYLVAILLMLNAFESISKKYRVGLSFKEFICKCIASEIKDEKIKKKINCVIDYLLPECANESNVKNIKFLTSNIYEGVEENALCSLLSNGYKYIE